MDKKTDPLVAAYRKEKGYDPPPPSGPLAHQWDYRGTKEQRENIGDWLDGFENAEPVEVGDDQEPLF